MLVSSISSANENKEALGPQLMAEGVPTGDTEGRGGVLSGSI